MRHRLVLPQFMAWQPTKWPVLIPDQPIVQGIAESHDRTPAQVLLQWSIQKGMVINPRSNKPAHMAENLAIFGNESFVLTPADMDAIAKIPVPKQNKASTDNDACGRTNIAVVVAAAVVDVCL
jgi:diketogulonate reductase-like aldo/keto reductase